MYSPDARRMLVVTIAKSAQKGRQGQLTRYVTESGYEEFEAEWSQRKPPEEILEFFGSWPDGAVVNPLIRM